MKISNLGKFTGLYGKIDAILIVNRHNIIEYSATVTEDREYLRTEDIIGKNLFEVYPSLNEQNSTHARVLRTGQPVINEKQTILERSGRKITLITSTFPIENDGEIIGSIDLSVDFSADGLARDMRTGRKKLCTVDDIITCDEKMLRIKDRILKLAKNDSSVMVIGESGTGKELVVESIHSHSRRRDKPFISLNCAAVPDSLIESILFGTVKGSFTGAENKKGLFELADQGTLFLDEINSMNMELQTKLLKVVEEQRYMKVGGETYLDVDVRLISAMNALPSDVIREGKLRQDLFYRLGVVQISLPPLRERKGDLPLLADHYIDLFNNKMHKQVVSIDHLAWVVLTGYSWPGNVREFRNTMESAFNLTDGESICISDLPDHLISNQLLQTGSPEEIPSGGLSQMVGQYEKEIITRVLQQSASLNKAASRLKLTRQALKYKIEKYEIPYTALLKKA